MTQTTQTQTAELAQPIPEKRMLTEIAHAAWLAQAAIDKATPLTPANFDLLYDTFSAAIRAIEDCRETK